MDKRLIVVISLSVLILGCAQQSPPEKTIISTDQAPEAIGPYSQAVQVGDRLYLSGQIGIAPGGSDLVDGGLEAEARQALENHTRILDAAGFSLDDVVQCQVFLRDMDQYSAFNEIYSEYFGDEYPARAVVEAARIPKDAAVEIMLVAEKSR